MAITIKSKNYKYETTYGGLLLLRYKIAELAGKEIYNLYKELDDFWKCKLDERNQWMENYNQKIEDFSKDKSEEINLILDFLYFPDCDAKISTKISKILYDLVKNEDKDFCFDTKENKNSLTYLRFKNILKDSIENNSEFIWY